MNLGVYISTLNEEVLIEAALKNLVKVFPQVEVIDLGSTDSTLDIIERLNVPINKHVLNFALSSKYTLDTPGREWVRLKNKYADKHDWILLLDGDEIFDEDNLLKLKAKAGVEDPYTAYHIGWKMLRETGTQKQISNMLPSGTKLFKSSHYYFKRGWPEEALVTKRSNLRNRPKGDLRLLQPISDSKYKCDIWCWHGVLLNRSSLPEATARRKKREERYNYYDTQLEWEDIDKWPWM